MENVLATSSSIISTEYYETTLKYELEEVYMSLIKNAVFHGLHVDKLKEANIEIERTFENATLNKLNDSIKVGVKLVHRPAIETILIPLPTSKTGLELVVANVSLWTLLKAWWKQL